MKETWTLVFYWNFRIVKRDGWMASLTRWTWVWVNSGSWWWTGRPGVLRFMGSQRVRHNWVTELNWTESMSNVTAGDRSNLTKYWFGGGGRQGQSRKPGEAREHVSAKQINFNSEKHFLVLSHWSWDARVCVRERERELMNSPEQCFQISLLHQGAYSKYIFKIQMPDQNLLGGERAPQTLSMWLTPQSIQRVGWLWG